MSNPDIPVFPAAAPVGAGPLVPPSERAKLSVLAVVSFALGTLFFIGLLIFRLINPIISNVTSNGDAIATALGVFGLLTILPVAVVVVLGHLALVATKPGRKRARGIGIAGLVLGYVLLAIYFNTVITAVVASSFPHGGPFIQNVFYWV